MSPLQFQKQLRLQEARRLMLGEELDAASAGYRVGYGDASHFTREYKRLFGAPPMRDVERLRKPPWKVPAYESTGGRKRVCVSEEVKMLEGKSSPTGSGMRTRVLVPEGSGPVREDRWRDAPSPLAESTRSRFRGAGGPRRVLPGEHAARGERPVVFRAISPSRSSSPRGDRQRACSGSFPRSLPSIRGELRRLSAAADPQRTLIGVRQDGRDLADMGPDQLGYPLVERHPGRQAAGAPLPSGRSSTSTRREHRGARATSSSASSRGKAIGLKGRPFESEWLPGQFSGFLEELQRHKAARNRARERVGRWARWIPRSRSGSRSA